MKLATIAKSNTGTVVAIGLMGAIAIYYAKKQAGEALSSVGDAVNPVSQDNIFNRGVNNVVGVLTGDENQTLGGLLYDLFNGTPIEQAARREEQSMIERLGG
jgi:hypothetical protein